MATREVELIPAVYVILHRDNDVLLIKRSNTGYMDGHWSLPAGHIEDFEKITEAAIRETKEEVGVNVAPTDLRLGAVCYRPATRKDHERVHFVVETDSWTGEITNSEPHKHSRVEWFSVSGLPENLVPEVALIFEQLAEQVVLIED